ncbi:MAG: hypothetical protein HW380_863 [Magnetococcales bacterium]|nr:hypothetical protein [Magnetococcales bacterium]
MVDSRHNWQRNHLQRIVNRLSVFSTNEFDWVPPGKQVAPPPFSTIVPEEVLYAFDGPRIFTFSDQDGTTFLAYLCDEVPDLLRFIIVPIAPQTVLQLEKGDIALRDVLTQPDDVWIVDLDSGGSSRCCWNLAGKELPDAVLPLAGITLLPNSVVSQARGARGASQPFDVHLGKQKGLQVFLRWTGSVSGEVLLTLDNISVWGKSATDISHTATCDLPHILTFLARGWHRLFSEEYYPVLLARPNLPEHPGRLVRNVLNGRRNSQMQATQMAEWKTFTSFLKGHLFSRKCSPLISSLARLPDTDQPGNWVEDDSIIFLRQGHVMLAATSECYFCLSLDETRKILEELGNAICRRLESFSISNNIFLNIIQSWTTRDEITTSDKRSLATGISPARLQLIWPQNIPGENRKNLIPVSMAEEPLCLAARMIGGLADDSQLKNLMLRIANTGRNDRGVLSSIRDELKRSDILKDDQNFRASDFRAQGMEVARWLRSHENIDHSTRFNPRSLLDEWKVDCINYPSSIPYDAIAVWGKTLGPVIYLNPQGPRCIFPTGIRFTLAHEIGHILMDMDRFLPFGDVICAEDGLYAFNGPETRANAFAAELLLPESGVRQQMEQLNARDRDKINNLVVDIADKFEVSHELTAWKMKHTHILSKEQESYLDDKLRSKNDPF